MKTILLNAIRKEKPYVLLLLVGGLLHLFFALVNVATNDLVINPIIALGMALLFFVSFLVNTDTPISQLQKDILIYILGFILIAYIFLSEGEDLPFVMAFFYPIFLSIFQVRQWRWIAFIYGLVYSVLLLLGAEDEESMYGTVDLTVRLLLLVLYFLQVLLILYFAYNQRTSTQELSTQLEQANRSNRRLVELFESVVAIARDTSENMSIIIKDLEDVVFVDEKYTKSLRGCVLSLSTIYEQFLLTQEQNELSRFNVHNFLVSLVRNNFSEFMQEFVPKYSLDENIPAEIIGNSKRLADAVNQSIQDRLWKNIHNRQSFEVKTTYLNTQEVKYVLIQLRCGNIPYPDAKELQQKRSEELEDLIGVRLFTQTTDRGMVVSFFLHVLEDTAAQNVPDAHPQPTIGLRDISIDFETAKAAIKDLHVLVAEDNDINQKVMTFLLANYVATIDIVSDGRKLLQKLNEQEYDLILTDVQMPHLNGLQATKHIREVEHMNGGHIPIIALTAYALPGEREKCLKAGMDEFLCKPFDDEHLVILMASVLEKDIPYRKDIQYQF